MSDRPRVPSGISNVRRTSRGWEARVSLYTDGAGFFGRKCPDPQCRTFFKLSVAEYEAAPENLQLTCPVCGLIGDHQRFITPEQKQRGEAAALEFARAAADRTPYSSTTSPLSGGCWHSWTSCPTKPEPASRLLVASPH